jgi:hypothetical protein
VRRTISFLWDKDHRDGVFVVVPGLLRRRKIECIYYLKASLATGRARVRRQRRKARASDVALKPKAVRYCANCARALKLGAGISRPAELEILQQALRRGRQEKIRAENHDPLPKVCVGCGGMFNRLVGVGVSE